MATDELQTLLESGKWVTRRVDRVEFLDLTTVRRTINLTVHARKMRELLPGRWDRRLSHEGKREAYIPLGRFLPWANAGATLLDADDRVIPYITSAVSDELVAKMVKRRLKRLPIDDLDLLDLVEKIPLHRKDPAARGRECPYCAIHRPGGARLKLMTDRWGCKAVRDLVEAIHRQRETGCCRCCKDGNRCDRRRREADELAMILLAWQKNFVLFAPLSALATKEEWTTLRLSFDEQLQQWISPLERARKIEKDHEGKLSRDERKALRGHVSRGGPFSEELDELFPRHLRGWLARCRYRRVRRLGERGLLGLTWHVAWDQASGLDTPSHQVDVFLPDELTAVRMRLLRRRESGVVANVADQVGSRATIVAPEAECANANKLAPSPPPPTLFSLTIAQGSRASWVSGAWLAGLTAVAILLTALLWLPTGDTSSDAITMLIVAPTLVSALLSVRARSELAEQLTTTLRQLIGAVGVLAAACAIGLLAQEKCKISPSALKWGWFGCSLAMLVICASLARGAVLIRRFIEVGREPSPRAVKPIDIEKKRPLNPTEAPGIKGKPPRISPPDFWLDADEGELVPWGWLDGKPDEEKRDLPPDADDYFWSGHSRKELVGWVQELFCYKP
jgi:hypothetical protein